MALGRFHDLRLVGLGQADQRAQRREVQLLVLADDLEQEIHGPDVGDSSDRFEHRLPQRLLRVERKDRREGGAVADLPQRLDQMELQPHVVAPEGAEQHRDRGGIAIFAERGDDRGKDVDVVLLRDQSQKRAKGFVRPHVAQKVHDGEAHVGVGLADEPFEEERHGRLPDPDQSLRRRVSLARVLRVAKRADQAADDLLRRGAQEAFDDRLPYTPVFVAEQLVHQGQALAPDGLHDLVRGLLADIGIRRARLVDQFRSDRHPRLGSLRPSSSRFISTNCSIVSWKKFVFWRTFAGTLDS